MSTTNKGDWAVAVKDASTGKGYFVHQAEHIDEQTARKAFGLAIRAIELDLPVLVDENDSVKASAVRLLGWDHNVIPVGVSGGNVTIYAEGGWKVVQEHQGSAIVEWHKHAEPLPYREDAFHPGVPCHPGAWGSPNACAMHWGLPLDDEYGMCAEGKRGAKFLGLVLVPKSIQTKWGMHQTELFDVIGFDAACVAAELVIRGEPNGMSEAGIEQAVRVFELFIAKAKRGT